MNLTEFLLARIAEDEHMAKVTAEAGGVRIPFNLVPLGCFNPARVLAECEAKRRIVERHAIYAARGEGDRYDVGNRNAALFDMQDLAAVYADHPDYDEAWRA